MNDEGLQDLSREERTALREQLVEGDFLTFQARAVRVFGPAAGIFARHLLFWDGRGHDAGGHVYKSASEWQNETGLSRRQQEKARKLLKKRAVLEEKKMVGPDGRLRLYFRLDLPRLMDALDPRPETDRMLSNSEQGPCPVKRAGTVLSNSEQGPCPPSRAATMPGNTERTKQRGLRGDPEGTSSPLTDGPFAGPWAVLRENEVFSGKAVRDALERAVAQYPDLNATEVCKRLRDYAVGNPVRSPAALVARFFERAEQERGAEPLNPHGRAAESFADKPRRADWYPAAYPNADPDEVRQLIEQGRTHSEIVAALERGAA